MLPVFVVDDHNDVLPCIHRMMGSKRIPFDHLVLIHLDSHSDLSVPLSLDADLIFNKEHLYSTTSIENWIIPLVFAGHVDTVVWVKPFWTAQSMKPSSRFHVGETIASNKIRVTSSDNYFLSELSYASKDVLTNTKSVDVHVVNVGNDEFCARQPSSIHEQNNGATEAQRATVAHHNVSELSSGRSTHIVKQGTADKPVTDSTPTSETLPPKRARRLENRAAVDDTRDAEAAVQLLVCNPQAGDDVKAARKANQLGVINTAADNDVNRDIEAASSSINEVFKGRSSAASFILDIDLDFFSTTDPFLSTLTDEQRKLMSELYKFTPPVDSSSESIAECVQFRQEQISYLQKIMCSMHLGQVPSLSDSARDRSIRDLLLSVMEHSSSPSDVIEHNPSFDYEWLHEIGTGIDDCPLPHHISTDTEINHLVCQVRSLLNSVPRPCAVTVARSSSDSYCPPHQVDSIQSKVIAMLKTLYGTLDINMNYLNG